MRRCIHFTSQGNEEKGKIYAALFFRTFSGEFLNGGKDGWVVWKFCQNVEDFVKRLKVFR
jgi:hypothetical protein